jgi:hypothetical protein
MIEKKLEILESSGVIDHGTVELVLKSKEYLTKELGVVDETALDMFLTHLAMANSRQKKGEPVNHMDEFIGSQIKGDPNFPAAKDLWGEVSQLGAEEFPEEERMFMYMHGLNLLSSKGV